MNRLLACVVAGLFVSSFTGCDSASDESAAASTGTIRLSIQGWEGADGYRLLALVSPKFSPGPGAGLPGGAFWTMVDSDPFSAIDVVHPAYWGEDPEEVDVADWAAGDYLWDETAQLEPGAYRIDFYANEGYLAPYGSHLPSGASNRCSVDVEVRAGEESTIVISGIPNDDSDCFSPEGTVSVTVSGLEGAPGEDLAGVLLSRTLPEVGFGGFAVKVDSDPFTSTRVLGEVSGDWEESGVWPWASGVANIPAGDYTLRLVLGTDYCCYSRWVPAETPGLRACHLAVTTTGEADEIRITDIPDDGSPCGTS